MKSLAVGPLGVNCYILESKTSDECMVIDPGGGADEILNYINSRGKCLKVIVNTHGHGDHIGAVEKLRKAAGAVYMVHEADAEMVKDADQNLSGPMGFPTCLGEPDVLLKENDTVSLGDISLKVIHTPGHTPGGICLYGEYEGEKVLFSGDSLFAEGIGRCDFPGGSMETLIRSLREKIMTLPEDTTVYPGHGPSSEIGWERIHNPYL